jgi:predicted ester cyclase
MSADRNIAVQERLAELVNTGDIDKLDEVFAPNVVDHDPAPGQRPGPDGFKDVFTGLRAAFPDLRIEGAALVTDEDHVCIAYTMSAHTRATSTGSTHGSQVHRARSADSPFRRDRKDRRTMGQLR